MRYEKKIVKLSDIIIPPDYEYHRPSAYKLSRAQRFYDENGRLDKDIILHESNVLFDGYTRYLVLRDEGVEEYECKVLKPANREETYVYATHTPGRGKEYVWRVPYDRKDILDNVHRGSKIATWTDNGRRIAYVTRVEKTKTPPCMGRIRSVAKVLG